MSVKEFHIKYTFSGVIQYFNSLSATLHEFFNIAICNTNYTSYQKMENIIFNIIVLIA